MHLSPCSHSLHVNESSFLQTTGGNNLSGLMNLDENVSDDSLDALALVNSWMNSSPPSFK